jgi:hypothetical protein
MRKVTQNTTLAFLAGAPFAQGNTSTDGQVLSLHGHRIAWRGTWNGASGVFLSLAGFDTRTTRDRLNGVLIGMGHAASHVDSRPVLRVKTKGGVTFIEEVGTQKRTNLQAKDVVFVVHPSIAKGIEAVSKAYIIPKAAS